MLLIPDLGFKCLHADLDDSCAVKSLYRILNFYISSIIEIRAGSRGF